MLYLMLSLLKKHSFLSYVYILWHFALRVPRTEWDTDWVFCLFIKLVSNCVKYITGFIFRFILSLQFISSPNTSRNKFTPFFLASIHYLYQLEFFFSFLLIWLPSGIDNCIVKPEASISECPVRAYVFVNLVTQINKLRRNKNCFSHVPAMDQ